ncbi:MAG: alkaline phosphatase family protein [Acetobacteraceae bacterium]|nr:alkaline phosphatase family protein [Acetobacteraceae bacterium]
MRSAWRRWPVVLVPLLLAAVGIYAQNLTLAEWNRVVDYQTPYARDLPRAAATARLTPQVVLVVVDGLRRDTSERLPFLEELRGRGASRVAITGQPSLSLPAVANFGMGAEPEIHGVTTNWYEGTAPLDSVFASARRMGLKTAVAGNRNWVQLYGGDLQVQRVIDSEGEAADDEVLEAAEEILEREHPALLVVHFSSLDEAGHSHGARSAEYAGVAAAIDSRLRELCGRLDLDRVTLIVASDHGHVLAGGHGGWEREVLEAPVILAGRGIKPGRLPPARQADVGPTIAALLGVGTPSGATGRAWLEALDAGERELAEKAVAQAEARLALASAYLEVLGAKMASGRLTQAAETLDQLRGLAASPTDGSWQEVLSGALALDGDLVQAMSAGRAERVARERWLRLPLSLVLFAVPAAAFALVCRRQRYFWPALAWGAGALALFVGLFYAHGLRFSLSAFNSESQIRHFFTQRLIESAGTSLFAAAGLGVTVGMAAGRRSQAGPGQGPGWQAAGAAVTATAFALFLLFVQVVAFYCAYGLSFSGLLPHLGWGLKFYLDLLQATAVGVSAPACPLLAAGLAWVAARLAGAVSGKSGVSPGRV